MSLLLCEQTGELMMNAIGRLTIGDSLGVALDIDGEYAGVLVENTNQIGGSTSEYSISFDATCRPYALTFDIDFGFTPDRVVVTTPEGDTVLDTGCTDTSPAGQQTYTGTLPECSTGLDVLTYYKCGAAGGSVSSIDSFVITAAPA